jgi:hypothetical protein
MFLRMKNCRYHNEMLQEAHPMKTALRLLVLALSFTPIHAAENAVREFKIDKQYLHLPINNGAAKCKVTILLDGRAEVKNDIELADSQPPDW